MCKLSELFKTKPQPQYEIPHPGDWIPRSAVEITPDGDVVFHLASTLKERFGLELLPKVDDWPIVSASMRPAMGRGNEYIYVSGRTPADHQKLVDILDIGDVAIYQMEEGNVEEGYAMHSIVKIEHDEKGRKFTFKGYYNDVPDPYGVREEHIKNIVLIISH